MTDYAKWKVTNLKAELKRRGIPQTGLKVKQNFIDKLLEADSAAADCTGGEESGAPEQDTNGLSTRIIVYLSLFAELNIKIQPIFSTAKIPQYQDSRPRSRRIMGLTPLPPPQFSPPPRRPVNGGAIIYKFPDIPRSLVHKQVNDYYLEILNGGEKLPKDLEAEDPEMLRRVKTHIILNIFFSNPCD
ncbi:hypothetical protein DTO166G4_1200 [Paecilomyces variotii]|nr:hypothetical protein DTO166G4_1200 [Paecilomyces variotii]KAJ9242199.1 hypothetical protein DTO166G5_602 [Paecilomyces variotii]KAJ9256970.1 hypothetical protein DTO195F2_5649 [Paecilomyces variotii]KAJ9305785.1 hypothetical protein DTO217A2_4698 [Paecilomyces variotii]KAJ9351363.1 hypothetical protein DTO027B9_6400 [Paecilomyces variotii]